MNEGKPFIKIDDFYYPISGIMFKTWQDDAGRGVSIFEIGTDDSLHEFHGKQAEQILAWLEDETLDLTVEDEA